EDFCKQYGNIRYCRNAVNVGLDLNIVNAVEHASGEYCWYMGDDDAVAPGALAALCAYLSGHRPAILTVADRPFDTDEDLVRLQAAPRAFHQDLVLASSNSDQAFLAGFLDGALSSYIFL